MFKNILSFSFMDTISIYLLNRFNWKNSEEFNSANQYENWSNKNIFRDIISQFIGGRGIDLDLI